MGQINSRRGNILGMEVRPGNAQAVRALVPLARNVWLCNSTALGYTRPRCFQYGI
jgi:hypothetical protein